MKKKQNRDHSIDSILSEILDEFESYDVVESREFHDSYEELFLFSSSNKELLIDAIVRWIDGREFKLLDDEDFFKVRDLFEDINRSNRQAYHYDRD